jgi:hypothetical protein
VHSRHEIRFTIYGAKSSGDRGALIPARLFKKKLDNLISALSVADRAENQKAVWELVISDLKVGSAEVALLERTTKKPSQVNSSIAPLVACANAVYRGNLDQARAFGDLTAKLRVLCEGIGSQFDRIEIALDGGVPIPMDDIFKRQIDGVFSNDNQEEIPSRYYTGQSIEEYDGVLGEIDYRSKLWRGILVLSGSTSEIMCVFPGYANEDEINRYGRKRVWASGNAIYDGTSPLPVRLEVSALREIKAQSNTQNWRGALKSAPELRRETGLVTIN